MTAQEELPQDPLIDGVRRRRRQLMASHGDDLQLLFETIERRQDERPDKILDLRQREAPPPGGLDPLPTGGLPSS